MSEEGTSSDDTLVDWFKRLCTSKNTELWKAFELWSKEDPSIRRKNFAKINHAMIKNMEYTANVYEHVFGTSESAFEKFGDVAIETGFVTGRGERCHQKLNVFTVLAELYAADSIYKEEGGPLLIHLQRYLHLLLPIGMGWRKLVIDPRIFRSLYFQLIKTFELDLEVEEDRSSSSGSSVSDKPAKGQLLYASFVASIIVSIWHDHSLIVSSLLPGFRNLVQVEDFLMEVVNSTHFRILSTFFLIGYTLILRYREEGGIVTQSERRPYSAENAEKDAQQFQQRLSTFNPPSPDFEFEGKDIEKQQCQVFFINLLRNGLLNLREPSISKATGVTGRPRKAAVSKRKISLEDFGSPRKMQKKAVEKSPTKKKEPRRSIRKDREDSDDMPGPSSTSPSPPPVTASTPRTVHPEELGLAKPVYVMQMDQVRWFLEEVERRRQNGVTEADRQKLKEKIEEHYDEMQRLSDLSMSREPMKLSKDQKAMMNHYKTTWRQVNPEPCMLSPVKEQKNGQVARKNNRAAVPEPSSSNSANASSSKAGKKWKRRW